MGGALTVYLQQQSKPEPVEAGEAVLGGLIAGLVGAGRSEVMQVLFGINPPDAGSVRLGGQQLAVDNPAEQRALAKIGMVTEGVVRAAELRGGRRHDHILFSILRPEWERLVEGE